ncbi:MAG TPA: hypothetical protein DCR24_14125 [Bacillus bacterium]|nr:hypothetical protein [Bacillus sp. (in: firmicutes)]
MNPLAGALIEIGFEGGPGTAAGLRSTFEHLGFEEGASLALGLATSGIIAGLISGVILVNWAVRKGITKQAKKSSELSDTEKKGVYSENDQPAGHLTTRSESIDSLTINFVFIFLSIGIGMILLKGLVMLENATWGNAYDVRVLEHLPLFPLALLGGVLIQVLYTRFIPQKLIDKKMMMRIQGFALDLLIVSAIATISLAGIGEHIYVFLILFAAGVSWNLFSFVFLAKKMLPDYWVERGILDYGQSIAMTTTGLMLLQMVDPEKETPAFDSFGYKQIIFEPIVGGGLFTAASMPLINAFGPVSVLIGTGTLMALWGGVGLFYFGKKQKNDK